MLVFIYQEVLPPNMYYGELTCLRAVESSDIDEVLKHWNDLNFRRLLGPPIPWSRKFLETWLEKRINADPWKDKMIELAITNKATGEFLGFIHLEDIKRPHSRAEFGISIQNPDNRSKGYGTDAIRVILWVAFNILGLHSVYLDTMEDNERAIRTYERVGFKRVGLLRETEFINGAYKGLLVMDILRDEFELANPSFNVRMKP
ncbi:N-acetyltransferase [Candidatus Thorarchaeota archaeon]|nr:MAG: N-acetyltransferase [Candidatus Thorarchaeota archaeon]